MTTIRALATHIFISCSLAANCVHATESGAPRRALRADDFYAMQMVSDPQLSPDGQWVAYLVKTNDRASDEQRSALWMVNWSGSERVQLTKATTSTASPRWSPDGHYLAYLAAPAGSETSQVMLLDRRGGEARALTQTDDEIQSLAWSPDGARLVLVIQGSDSAAAAPAAQSSATKSATAPQPIVVDAMTSSSGYYDQYGTYFSDVHESFEIHVYDNYTHGSADLYFDDVVFTGGRIIATNYNGGIISRYIFKRY